MGYLAHATKNLIAPLAAVARNGFTFRCLKPGILSFLFTGHSLNCFALHG
ncbi:MAG: hypothetical protein JWP03_3523 [Phycisphaerales bacterium]|nr:hypothetical protein [Phycisphaerales bacterium]